MIVFEELGGQLWNAKWPGQWMINPGDKVPVKMSIQHFCFFDAENGQLIQAAYKDQNQEGCCSMNKVLKMKADHNQVDFEKVKKQQRTKNLLKGLLFLLPSIILFSIFIFYPMIRTIYLSLFLTNQAGVTTVFVGIQNYLDVFSSPIFLKSLKSTFLFVLYTVPGTIIVSLFLAIIANEKLKGIGVFRMIFSSSMGVSVAAASVFWLFLFHPSIGFFNRILETFGLDKIGWLTDPSWALLSVSLSTIWMNIGLPF